jgi:hypothetical protein
MAAASVQHDIIDLVAEERGLAPEKVKLHSELLDLGMDGDDAVEFFKQFEERYDVDLTPLYEHWGAHFGPEGFGSPTSCAVMFLLLIFPLPLIPLGIHPFWVWGVEIAALLLWRSLRPPPSDDRAIPITVQDLVIAAEMKRWPLDYAGR